jgi:hypothetical protein
VLHVPGTRIRAVAFESLLDCRQAWSDAYYGSDMPDGWDEQEEQGVDAGIPSYRAAI